MHVRLRLARWGARNNPFFGIVAAPKAKPRDGRHLERLGTYNPIPVVDPSLGDGTTPVKSKHVQLNVERIKYWLSVGAQPSRRVAWLLAKAGIMPPQPKQLQKIGAVAFHDMKTWDVKIMNEKGEVLEIISAEEAQNRYMDSEGNLPKGIAYDKQIVTEPSRLIHKNIKLDGTPPTEPLTPDERLFVLKKFTGII
ncbi:hypothetical protein HK102_000954 [Quaeritorhiza haematococci]|nr:hypothetical protein HK102_000954 [Quaeritorhiza haematococci]